MLDVPGRRALASPIRAEGVGGGAERADVRGVRGAGAEGAAGAGLRAWAAKRADPVSARLAGLEPGRYPGTVAVPLPRIEHGAYKALIQGAGIPKRVEAAPVVRVPIGELTAIQGSVNAERLQRHLEDPRLIPKGARTPSSGMLKDRPVVVRLGDKSYLHDGHHRVLAAMLRGERDIKARVVDLEGETR